MDFGNMQNAKNDNNPPSVFNFDSYPGLSQWQGNIAEEFRNSTAFSGYLPSLPNQFAPIAPAVPSSFCFGNDANFTGQFPFQITSNDRLVLGKRKTESPPPQPTKQLITEEKMAEHMSKLHISSETATPLEPESVKNKRLYMCEEMRKLQSDCLLPASLLAAANRPCTALVLWQPPPKLMPALGDSHRDKTKSKSSELEDLPELPEPTPNEFEMDLDL